MWRRFGYTELFIWSIRKAVLKLAAPDLKFVWKGPPYLLQDV